MPHEEMAGNSQLMSADLTKKKQCFMWLSVLHPATDGLEGNLSSHAPAFRHSRSDELLRLLLQPGLSSAILRMHCRGAMKHKWLDAKEG